MTTTYMRRANAGVCVRCESPRVRNGRRCETCRNYGNRTAEARRAETQIVGGCIRCGGVAVAGHSRCNECREINAQRSREFREAAKCQN